MTNQALFDRLFVFEMANNHMGDLQHGFKVMEQMQAASKDFGFKCAMKFQYRNLDTFIHPAYKSDFSFKYIKRFTETKLLDDDLIAMKEKAESLGFVTMCTPFDEASVDKIVKFGFDIIKIASCSFTDWPLLEKIADTNLPIIASTAGASIEEIDRVVVFFEHRKKQLAIMHCVGEYPTETSHLELNQIDFFRQRYPNITVGYSTHEDPDNVDAIKMAVAKGAKIFERHVGVATDKYLINGYSSTPEQVTNWLASAKEAFQMCGVEGKRREITQKERGDLKGLMRAVYAKEKIAKGQKITPENAYYAIPNLDGHLVANEMSKYKEYVAEKDFAPDDPVLESDVSCRDLREHILDIIKKVKGMLVDSKIFLPHMLNFELTHHYGIERFNEYGAVIIDCINREYCKKIILVLPGQKHPAHFHKKKEETFQVISGELILDLGDGEQVYGPGSIVVVEREVSHNFRSDKGAIFEEVSTTHYLDDSFYDDDSINNNPERKTRMTFWSDWLYKDLK